MFLFRKSFKARVEVCLEIFVGAFRIYLFICYQ